MKEDNFNYHCQKCNYVGKTVGLQLNNVPIGELLVARSYCMKCVITILDNTVGQLYIVKEPSKIDETKSYDELI